MCIYLVPGHAVDLPQDILEGRPRSFQQSRHVRLPVQPASDKGREKTKIKATIINYLPSTAIIARYRSVYEVPGGTLFGKRGATANMIPYYFRLLCPQKRGSSFLNKGFIKGHFRACAILILLTWVYPNRPYINIYINKYSNRDAYGTCVYTILLLDYYQ